MALVAEPKAMAEVMGFVSEAPYWVRSETVISNFDMIWSNGMLMVPFSEGVTVLL